MAKTQAWSIEAKAKQRCQLLATSTFHVPYVRAKVFHRNIHKDGRSSDASSGSQRQEVEKMEEKDGKRELSDVHGGKAEGIKAPRARRRLRTRDGCGNMEPKLGYRRRALPAQSAQRAKQLRLP